VLFEQVSLIVNGYPVEAFYQRPFANAKGYHSKTLSYSIWHIFRIEDIVAHTLIAGDEQLLVTSDYLKKIDSPIITTGNELHGQEILEFSKKLNIKASFTYAKEVMLSTNSILSNLEYAQMKTKYSDANREILAETGCVSPNENALWLKSRLCLYGNMGRKLFLRYMIGFMRGLILPKRKRFWGRICVKD